MTHTGNVCVMPITRESLIAQPAAHPRPGRKRRQAIAALGIGTAATLMGAGVGVEAASAAAAPAAADGPVLVLGRPSAAQARTELTWGISTGTLYFKVGETTSIGQASSVASICAGFNALGQPAGAILGTYCAANAFYISYVAREARSQSACLKIKFGLGYANPSPQTYTGGYCHK